MAQRDIFLRIEGSRQGLLRGESQDLSHPGEIDVLSWSWGMDSPGDAFGLPTGRTHLELLRLTKRVDSASTALMSALRANEPIRKAVLTVRKAGGEPLACFTLTLEHARLVQQRLRGGEGEDSTLLTEELALSFQKVRVEYLPQCATGVGSGMHTFETVLNGPP